MKHIEIFVLSAFFFCGCTQGFKSNYEAQQNSNSSLTTIPTTLCTPKKSRSCTVANGLGSQLCQADGSAWNTCLVASCLTGYARSGNACAAVVASGCTNGASNYPTCNACSANTYFNGTSCVAQICVPQSTKSCDIAYGAGSQACQANGSAWNACQVTSCTTGYTVSGNTCAPVVASTCANGASNYSACNACSANKYFNGTSCVAQICVPQSTNSCDVANGAGSQTCSANGSAWAQCLATSCSPEFTASGTACIFNMHLVQAMGNYLSKCWKDGKITCSEKSGPNVYIGTPVHGSGTVDSVFNFPIRYTNAENILLNPDQVSIEGSGVTGCQKTVTGSGNTYRNVSISRCSGDGVFTISIDSGSAVDKSSTYAAAFGPSTSIVIFNSNPNVAFSEKLNEPYTVQNGTQLFDLYFPSDWQTRPKMPALIWIHGGGWTGGNRTSDVELLRAIAKSGIVVVSVEYSLATSYSYLDDYPMARLPATSYQVGMNDVQSFVTMFTSKAASVNIDVNKISIAGGSAGGHLALYQATNATNTFNFNCVISMAGPTILTKTYVNYPVTNYIITKVFGNSISILQGMSPSFFISRFKANKLILIYQVQDNLVPIDQVLELMSQVKSLRPSLDVTLNLHNDTNPSPLLNPQPTEITHVDLSSLGANPIIGLLKTKCQ